METKTYCDFVTEDFQNLISASSSINYSTFDCNQIIIIVIRVHMWRNPLPEFTLLAWLSDGFMATLLLHMVVENILTP